MGALLETSTRTDTRTYSSSQPRQRTPSSAQWLLTLCPTSSAQATLRTALSLRTAVSQSTAARDGPTLCSTTTRSSSWALPLSLWATTTSLMLPLVMLPRLSTPSATSDATTARSASSSTTPPYLSTRKRACVLV